MEIHFYKMGINFHNRETNFHKMGIKIHNRETYFQDKETHFYNMDMNQTNIYINGSKRQIIY